MSENIDVDQEKKSVQYSESFLNDTVLVDLSIFMKI